MAKLYIGIAMLVAVSAVLAFFARVHRPFTETPVPFFYAFLGIFAVLAALIFIVSYFVKVGSEDLSVE